MDLTNDLSHLPTVRFQASSFDDVSKRINAWELLFKAKAVLRVRGHAVLGGGQRALVDGRVVRRMRSYLTVEAAGLTHVVLTRKPSSYDVFTITVGQA